MKSHPAMAVSMEEAGSLVIDVEGNRLTSRFINDEGVVKDEFSIQKEDGFTSNYTGCILKKEKKHQENLQQENSQQVSA